MYKWVCEHADFITEACAIFGEVKYKCGCKPETDDNGVLVRHIPEGLPCPVCGYTHVNSLHNDGRSQIICAGCDFEVEAIGGIAEAYTLWNLSHNFVNPFVSPS